MTDHKDHRELGFGNVDARPDIDGTPGANGGGESCGGARSETTDTTGGAGSPGGQTDPAYRGGDNPNATRDGDGGDAQ
ncbi:hypothetical protein KZX46_04565 [Polymorphobacter sp. PAMC 29334]|uniref:hypothetical protein n=1 Tax=Polymorphobacter sp. PAMC 29334 TaxID=2862331 RepID=UPI001C782C04|nr:hypothetical protein [Polymorphobacter sp. PAMC 29334]QYE35274.1 hypothetical protein KZX46_04565 [Polymorphobacter sp. PAMC 29334]